MKGFRSLFLILLVFCTGFAEPKKITIAGTGLTGLWTAYTLSEELEKSGNRDELFITIIGKWDWLSELIHASSQKTTIFSHEASGFGPIGIQPHSGLLWNTDNEVIDLVKKGIGRPEASFYTDPDLEEEGREFLDLYVGWHSRHLDINDKASSFQRQRSLLDMNRYARKLWGEFHEKIGKESEEMSFYLEGAWRLYDDPVHFANALKSLSILERFDYGAEAVESFHQIAERVPFYQKIITQDQKKGIFFKEDGLINSNELRKFLWSRIMKNPNVRFIFDEVVEITMDSQGANGVVLKSGKVVDSDITILAMGLGNKHLLAKYGITLPLWNVWGASLKAKLTDASDFIPKGGVSFHTQRCITAIPDGKTIVIAGTSMVISENQLPTPNLYEEKLKKSMQSIFGGRYDETTFQFQVAPRTGIADDLPIIDLGYEILNLIILNPTSHLGNTQSIALGNLGAHTVLKSLSLKTDEIFPLNLNEYRLDRFKEDIQEVRKAREEGKSVVF